MLCIHCLSPYYQALRSSCEPSRQTKQISSSPSYQPQDSWAPGQFLPYRPLKSQAPSQLSGGDDPTTEQGSVTTHRTLSIKIKQLQVESGELGLKLLPGSETRNLQGLGMPSLSSASSEELVTDSYAFM